MRRFVQEAKAAAALNHPNIAHIYEIGEHDGSHFIAMEYIDGFTFRERTQQTPIKFGEVLDVAAPKLICVLAKQRKERRSFSSAPNFEFLLAHSLLRASAVIKVPKSFHHEDTENTEKPVRRELSARPKFLATKRNGNLICCLTLRFQELIDQK